MERAPLSCSSFPSALTPPHPGPATPSSHPPQMSGWEDPTSTIPREVTKETGPFKMVRTSWEKKKTSHLSLCSPGLLTQVWSLEPLSNNPGVHPQWGVDGLQEVFSCLPPLPPFLPDGHQAHVHPANQQSWDVTPCHHHPPPQQGLTSGVTSGETANIAG